VNLILCIIVKEVLGWYIAIHFSVSFCLHVSLG